MTNVSFFVCDFRPKLAVQGIKKKIAVDNPHVSTYALGVSYIALLFRRLKVFISGREGEGGGGQMAFLEWKQMGNYDQ